MNVLESYLMIPFIKISGLNAVSARLPMLLVNLLSLYALYAFCRQICGKEALYILFIMAINPWHIMLSRWGLESNLYPAFTLFAMCFLQKGLRKQAYLYISMLFFGLSMYAYGIAYFSTPLLLIALACYLAVKKLVAPRSILCCAGTYLAIAWPIFAMMVINHFKLPGIYTPFLSIPYFPDTVRTQDLLPFSQNILQQAVNNLYSLLNLAFFQFPDTPRNSLPAFGPLYLFSMPLIITGGYRVVKEHLNPGGFMLLCWLATGINRSPFVRTVPIIAYTVAFTLFIRAYFVTERHMMADSFYDGFGEAITYAEAQDSPVLYITSNTQYQNAHRVSEILTMFDAKTDALYFQGQETGAGPDGLFIFNAQEAYLFTDPSFEIISFGRYCVGRIVTT